MKENKSLKQKLNSNEITIHSWITLDNAFVAEIMTKVAFGLL
jgi:2-keto-3-deoxy-L-rhamnonate aldolase RhmA